MKRTDLEHILHAAGAIAQVDELIVLGSQAILGSHPEAPAELLISQEADTYPPKSPEKADLIDGSIGELSPFHEQFGYYAHGVGPETAILPKNWRQRLVRIDNANTGGIVGLCLHPTDLAISKLVAGREKDLKFVELLLKRGLLMRRELEQLLPELSPAHADTVRNRLEICARR